MRGGGDASAHDDALLSRVYQQISEVQEPHFAAGYDLRAGMDRYRAWLGGPAEAAASVPAASVPAASVPAASVPAASVPAASVPAASVPAASVPAADVTMPLRAVVTQPG